VGKAITAAAAAAICISHNSSFHFNGEGKAQQQF